MATISFIIFLIILSVFLFFLSKKLKVKLNNDEHNDDLKTSYFLTYYSSIGSLVFLLILCLVLSIYTIDEGEGVILTNFGKIYDQSSEAGVSFKRPWADVIRWKIRLKAVNQNIPARTSDDMQVDVETTIWWKVQSDKMDVLYSSIAKNYESLEKGFVIPGIRSAIRDEVAKITYREFNINREKYAQSITNYVIEKLSQKHVVVDKINIRNIVPPQTVNDAIELKLKAKQDAEKAEFDLQKAKKEADIKRAEAEGIADSQSIIQRKLTPLYVQWYAVEAYKKLAESENTTFVIMPTSSKGAGMPLILGTK